MAEKKKRDQKEDVYQRRKALLAEAKAKGFITVDLAWAMFPSVSRSAISNDLRWLAQNSRFLSRSVGRVKIPPYPTTYKFTYVADDLTKDMIGVPVSIPPSKTNKLSIEEYMALPRFARALVAVDTSAR